jgi:hypothetical protein
VEVFSNVKVIDQKRVNYMDDEVIDRRRWWVRHLTPFSLTCRWLVALN